MVYGVLYIVNIIAHSALRTLGFRKRTDCSTSNQLIYHRPGRPIKNSGTGTGQNFGHGDGNGNGVSASPIVFVHGIGIGFAHYIQFLAMLPTEVDIYLLEWPYVAMQVSLFYFTVYLLLLYICSILNYISYKS